MLLLNYVVDQQPRLGAKTENGVIDVAAVVGMLAAEGDQTPTTMEALVAGGPEARAALARLLAEVADQSEADFMLDEADLQLSYCVPKPEKILCVGLNYRKHAAESGMAIPETPVLFSKFNNALAAPGEAIPLLAEVDKYDYEVELAVVMGRRARYVSEAEALDYVLGYCTANDISERGLQFRTGQWLLVGVLRSQ